MTFYYSLGRLLMLIVLMLTNYPRAVILFMKIKFKKVLLKHLLVISNMCTRD